MWIGVEPQAWAPRAVRHRRVGARHTTIVSQGWLKGCRTPWLPAIARGDRSARAPPANTATAQPPIVPFFLKAPARGRLHEVDPTSAARVLEHVRRSIGAELPLRQRATIVQAWPKPLRRFRLGEQRVPRQSSRTPGGTSIRRGIKMWASWQPSRFGAIGAPRHRRHHSARPSLLPAALAHKKKPGGREAARPSLEEVCWISAAATTRSAGSGWPAPASRWKPGRGSAPWRARWFPSRSRCLRCGCARR